MTTEVRPWKMDDDGGLVVGDRVEVKGKDLVGTIRFIGPTDFAPTGRWVGVELDEAKGKNNGLIQGKQYFHCPDNHGLFVRPGQVVVTTKPPPLPQEGSATKKTSVQQRSSGGGSGTPKPSGLQPPRSKLTQPGKGPSPTGSPGVPRRSAGSKAPTAGVTQKETSRLSTDQTAAVKDEAVKASKQQQQPPAPPPAAESEEEPRVRDLEERLAVLQHKRQEDKARMKELERYKAQAQQLLEYKQKWTEAQADLQQSLKAAKREVKEAVEEKRRIEEEFRELSDGVEMATLDKEMAEERAEGLQIEVEALKEKVEELTLDLDILRNEISESGVEGAAGSFQMKQLEQQNQRLKEALVKLRDISTQEKQEHQQTLKELDRQSAVSGQLVEDKEKLREELLEAENIIDQLSEQVDAALGAEEMVEKLTDRNLNLEEKVQQLQEQVDDLETLKELSEEQEELRGELEQELREEVDLSQNKTREWERRVEASQEVIVDLQQTIEKFRELVRNQQADILELRQKGASERGQELVSQSEAIQSLNRQLQATTVKAHSRTMEFELRKFEAQQAAEEIKLLKSFLPNSFLASGGDYDALHVVMLLPRILFKSELIVNQLRQQHKLEEALEKKQPLLYTQGDLVVFAANLISKVTLLQQLVQQVQRILNTCDVQLYRQMGSIRDDLAMHERALDHFINLLKTEQLDESVPLGSLEKAATYFKNLLDTRLSGVPLDHSETLIDSMKVVVALSEAIAMETMRVRAYIPDGCGASTQLKDLNSVLADLRLLTRKVRRRVPTDETGKTLQLPDEVLQNVLKCQDAVATVKSSMTQLKAATSRKGNVLSEGEFLRSAEVEDLLQQVSSVCPPVMGSLTATDRLRANLDSAMEVLNGFATAAQNGEYDMDRPAVQPSPSVRRAALVKSELSDAEGLEFRLNEKDVEMSELRKTIGLKEEELSETKIRIGLLEKKVEAAELEGERKAEAERAEIKRLKALIEQKDSRFERAINVMQNDIDELEREKLALHAALDEYKKGARGASGVSAIFGMLTKPGGAGGGEASVQETGVLGEKVKILRHALASSHNDNQNLRSRLAKIQMASLPPLNLLPVAEGKREKEDASKQDWNQTDQEKAVAKQVSSLRKELIALSASPKVVDITGSAGLSRGKVLTPRQQLSNQFSQLLDLQRRSEQLKEKTATMLASRQPGGAVKSGATSFVSPNFSQVLQGVSSPKLVGRLKVPGDAAHPRVCPVVMTAREWRVLHSKFVN